MLLLFCGFRIRVVHYFGNGSFWTDEAMLALNILARSPLLWSVCFYVNHRVFIRAVSCSEYLENYWRHLFLPLPFSWDAIVVWYKSAFQLTTFMGFRFGWQPYTLQLAAAAFAAIVRKFSDVTLLISLVFFVSTSASLAHLYPFGGRLSLYLMPLFILLITRGLQSIAAGKTIILAGVMTAADDYVVYGATSTSGADAVMKDLAIVRRHARVWLLFGYSQIGEDKHFVANLSEDNLEKHSASGATLYLFQNDPATHVFSGGSAPCVSGRVDQLLGAR